MPNSSQLSALDSFANYLVELMHQDGVCGVMRTADSHNKSTSERDLARYLAERMIGIKAGSGVRWSSGGDLVPYREVI